MGEEKFSWRALHTAWLLLALLFAGVAFFVIKQGGVGFNTALVYGLSAVIIAELVYIKAEQRHPNIWAMLLGAVLGSFPVVVAASSFDATAAIWLEGAGIVGVWVLNNQDGFGSRAEKAAELTVAPMIAWALWGFVFLYQHMSGLAWQSGIYHLGILLFAGFSATRLLGLSPENDKTQKWTIYLLALAVIGLLLITNLGQALSFG